VTLKTYAVPMSGHSTVERFVVTADGRAPQRIDQEFDLAVHAADAQVLQAAEQSCSRSGDFHDVLQLLGKRPAIYAA
jgi:hypothetical protein